MDNLDILKKKINKKKLKISVLGLGYVGLPVAYNFAKKFEVVGFDINKKRVTELKKFKDKNNSFTEKQLRHINIFFSSETKYY